jgi:alkyl sulfatase BDS1-like metallo-beta-lactamase superfamily hydrolase
MAEHFKSGSLSDSADVAKGDLEILAPWMKADFSEQLIPAVLRGNVATQRRCKYCIGKNGSDQIRSQT